jgi:hypothetical protein
MVGSVTTNNIRDLAIPDACVALTFHIHPAYTLKLPFIAASSLGSAGSIAPAHPIPGINTITAAIAMTPCSAKVAA